jgi:hypothetical protein
MKMLVCIFVTVLCGAAAAADYADGKLSKELLQKQKATEFLAQTAKPFTIAVLPDTQYYCDTRLKLSTKWGNGDLRRYFFAQTEWVRDNQERLNIAFLVHEGDIVQADDPEEWAIAKEAMSILDGKVPYCMCLGNHDMGFEKADNKYGGNIGVNRTTHFNTYFPREKFAKRREFGGTFDPDRHDNSWYHFEAAGLKFLVVALEYHPRDDVLDWANRIVAEHPDRRAIVLTHSYLKGNKTRTTNRLLLKGNNGEQMWQKFVRKHKNVFMVLCGHFSGEAVLTSTGDHGNQVHQILSDYQEMNNGGESWLRYMVFQPEVNKIGIYTYSPALDTYRNGGASRFDLDYPMTLPAESDVVVYGGTPGGITAAIAAARDGASVILLEQTRHVGGLTTSGLNRDECNHLDRQTLGGLCEQFLSEAVKQSNGMWTEGGSRTWLSGIAEQVFLEMLEKAGVKVQYEQLLDKVKKDGSRITELRVQGGESYRAKVFIDATYEGDLMARAGVSYSIGRESAEQYGESIAGVRYLDDKVAISPFDDDGKLLFGVMPGKPPIAGSASEVPICYNVRLNLTTEEANRVPIEKPNSYDPMQHELLARALEAGLLKNLASIIGIYPMANSGKRELNNRQFSIVSMSIPGAQTPWAEASFEAREAIHQKYRDYTHGMLWFLKSDPRVPEHIRSEMAPYGFCKDEWADNDHWPYYLYIRAARRMQGEVILTEADIISDREKEDVIHVGSHFTDCHHAARYVSDSGHIINEGRIWKIGARFDIPYRSIIPKAGECSNLLVPVCASASHVAFCTIRLEPTWMHLGEAAGIAAAMAGKSGESVQEVDIKSLQARLLELGIPLEHPEGPMAYEKKHGKPRTFAPDDVVKEFFASADKNGDGMASKFEWDLARPKWEWLFVHIDKDKNGQLNRVEYKAFQDFKKANPGWRRMLESQ